MRQAERGSRAISLQQRWGAAAQGDEGDAHVVEAGQVLVGGQLGVEDQVPRELAVVLLPELDEAEDLVGLLALAQVGVGVAEGVAVGVLGQEGEDAVLAAAAHGDVVALDDGVLAVVGNGVEVEIEGAPRQAVVAVIDPRQAASRRVVLAWPTREEYSDR